MIMHNNALVGS